MGLMLSEKNVRLMIKMIVRNYPDLLKSMVTITKDIDIENYKVTHALKIAEMIIGEPEVTDLEEMIDRRIMEILERELGQQKCADNGTKEQAA